MSKTDEPDEVLDLVDDQDVVIGSVTREEVGVKLLGLPGNVRASDCFIVNSQGQIWVPRRTPHKRVAPGGLDFSAGEHVKSGETYKQAMVRGFKEELRMDIKEAELEHIGTLDLRELNLIPYLDALFVYHTDTAPDYNKDDFVSYEWLAPAAFLEKVKTGEPTKLNMLPALELYLKTNK